MPNRAYRHITGFDGALAFLEQIPNEIRTEILGAAVAAGAQPLKVAAKRFAKRSERTGALRASIDHVVRKYPGSGVAVAIVGPTRDYFRGRTRLGKADSRRGAEQPSRYAHLVEFGHRMVTGGSLRPQYSLALMETGKFSKNGKPIRRWKRAGIIQAAKGKVVGWVPPKPFLRPAHYTASGQISDVMVRTIGEAIERTRRRMIRRGEHAA